MWLMWIISGTATYHICNWQVNECKNVSIPNVCSGCSISKLVHSAGDSQLFVTLDTWLSGVANLVSRLICARLAFPFVFVHRWIGKISHGKLFKLSDIFPSPFLSPIVDTAGQQDYTV